MKTHRSHARRRFFLADDLTGTLEIGAILKQQGRRVLMGIADVPAAADDQSVVIDCQTRRSSAAAALQRYSKILQDTRASAGELYLKLDSTLRGNVAAALGAARAQHPGHNVVFCPAYPAQGRTVIGGQVLVHGEPLCPRSRADESLEPVVSGDILSVLNQLERPLRHVASVDELYSLLRRTEAGMIVCCDARTDDDLCDIWAALAKLEDEGTPPVVLAGSAGLLAAKFQKTAGIALDNLRGRKWIVVGGSMNPISRGQLLQSPWTIFRPPATHADVLDYLSGHDGVVLATPSEPSEAAVTSWLLIAARSILEQGAASGLIVFGGDTAAALLAACGIHSLEPAGEVLPGVPCSWINLGKTRLALITKAGGFGAPDLLNRMIGEINKI